MVYKTELQYPKVRNVGSRVTMSCATRPIHQVLLQVFLKNAIYSDNDNLVRLSTDFNSSELPLVEVSTMSLNRSLSTQHYPHFMVDITTSYRLVISFIHPSLFKSFCHCTYSPFIHSDKVDTFREWPVRVDW